MAQAHQPQVSPVSARRQLDRLLCHPLFQRSGRMGRFLRLAVEWSLEGRAGELKEYLIGVEVFDRRESYDPRVDPIVRVEARRLRSKLKAYYEGDGRDDEIVIELATGSYAPQIHRRAITLPAAAPAPAPHPIAPPEASVNTIAVLPFADLSGGSEHQYLSDGLTEELIHALTKVQGMRVVAWNSAARLRERQQDMIAVREQLHAATALTGSIRISGTALRVRVQLIDTETGVYLWSESFDRPMQDVFAIQEEIARATVKALSARLVGGSSEVPVGRIPTSLSSYDLYLQGRYQWHRRTPDGLRQSIELFEAAIAADARSALAYSGLADGYSLLVDYGLMEPNKGMPRARQAARRAVELDPNLAEAYPSLAIVSSHYERNWRGAARLYCRAVELNPGYATTQQWLATDYYMLLGKFEEAQVAIDLAAQLDPLSSIIHQGRGFLQMIVGKCEESIVTYRKVLESDPSFHKIHSSMGRTYLQQGNYAEGIALLEKARSLVGDVPNILGALGQGYALAGAPDRARELLHYLKKLEAKQFVPVTPQAIICLGLGECDEALALLERGFEIHEPSLTSLGVHPVFDPLRGHPRFESLLVRLGLH